MFKLFVFTIIVFGNIGCFQKKQAPANTPKPKHFLEHVVSKEDYVPGVYDENPEPPYPDLEEDIKTLKGIDADKDGLRDDLEIWINRNGVNRNERELLRHKARLETKILVEPSSINNGEILLKSGNRLSGCAALIETNPNFSDIVYYLGKYITNTHERNTQLEKTINLSLPVTQSLPTSQEIAYLGRCFCPFEIHKEDHHISSFQVKAGLVELSKFKLKFISDEITEKRKRGYYEKNFGIDNFEYCRFP